MIVLLLILAAWVGLSIPVALALGHFLRHADIADERQRHISAIRDNARR